MRANHRRILWVVLAINAAMFLIEGVAGLLANSTSLLADALDMLGDALVYGFSLFALSRSARWQAGAALAKGAFMLALGLGVLGEAAYKVFIPAMPGVETMGIIHRRSRARRQPHVLFIAVSTSQRQPQHEFDLAMLAQRLDRECRGSARCRQ